MIKKTNNRANILQKSDQICKNDEIISEQDTAQLIENDPIKRQNNKKKTLKAYIHHPIKFATSTVLIAFLIFGIWGNLAQLDSAVVAKGIVIVDGKSKDVQHYEGGIISAILVEEGQEVKAEQPLMILNQTAANSILNSTASLLRQRAATEKRLLAEMNNQSEIDFSHPFLQGNEPEITLIKKNQLRLFNTKKAEFISNSASFKEEEQKIISNIKGAEEQKKIAEENFKMHKEKLKDIEQLYNKGIVSKHNMLAIRREYQEVQARSLHVKSEYLSLKQELEKVKAAHASFESHHYAGLLKEYEVNHLELLDLEGKYLHHKNVLERTTIKAPVGGVVTGLQHHTIGGIARPGEILMRIVPSKKDFIIEAQIAPHEINNIKVGGKAKVSLDPYKQRLVPRVKAEIVYVSADRLTADGNYNNQSGSMREYYLIKMRINPQALNAINTEVKLYPGMPVTVFLVRGTRTFMQYMLSPITESFHRAMKEQ